jgi:diguanylate cyclase (GGDEF)-like protein
VKILCVEDDQGLATLLYQSLVKQHYQVEQVFDGQIAWELAEIETYDLILLDWMLPNLTGIEFCQRLRSKKSALLNPNRDTPILLMTGLDSATSKVMGLDAGADDYVVKPFDLDELLARIRALLRRSRGTRSPLLQWGDLCLNPNNCEVIYQGQPILLAAKEYEILELFLRNPDQIFSLNRLLIALWAVEDMPSEGAVRAHIKGLRQKLKRAGASDPIDTIYKLGYRLKPQQASTDKLPVTGSSPSFSLAPEFREVWQECRQSYCDRLLRIHQAALAMQHGTLSTQQHHEAEREAHTLIGSLGSFGLEAASQIARQIQQLLKQQAPLTTFQIEQLIQLITALRLHLEEEREEKSQGMVSPLPLTFSTSLKSTSTFFETNLLVIDNDLPWAQLLAEEAISWGFQAQIATDLETVQQILATGSINVILLDLSFPNDTSSLEFLATTHRQYPNIPVVTLTAAETFEQRVEASRLGIQYFLLKPITPTQVLTTVTQVLHQTNQPAARVLIVDDDPELLKLLSSLLKPCGYQVTLLREPQRFWQVLEQTAPDLLILDIEFCEPIHRDRPDGETTAPTLSGIELCQVIRSDLRWNRLPVLFLSAHTELETVQRGFAVGADDFLSKPVSALDLLTRVRTRLKQRNLWEIADIDELTGVSLRRKAQQDLTGLIRLAQRQQQPFTLALLDLDHFKQVNDRYGHDAGDQVLRYLGRLLHQSFRQEDVVGRWGGEEFIVGLYGMTKKEGSIRLREVLDRLRQYVFLAQNQVSFRVTFSAGVAQSPTDGDELQTLYHCADRALYRAKAVGRNRVLVYEPMGQSMYECDA